MKRRPILALLLRPHCLHALYRCGLVLQMSIVAWSVCLCVGLMCELCCAKTADPIKMPYEFKEPDI